MISNDEAIVMGGISATNMTLFHQTRFRVGDPLAFADISAANGARKRTLIVRDIELDRARQHARADVFASPIEFAPATGLSGERDISTAQALAQCVLRAGVKRAVCDRTFPALFMHVLVDAGISMRCDLELFQSARRSKDAAELKAMDESQRTTEDAIELACRLIARAGVNANGELVHQGAPLTSERVRAEIDIFFARHGFENPRSIVAGGPQGADCHHDGDGPHLLGVNQPLALNGNLHSDSPANLVNVILHGVQQPASRDIGFMPGFEHSLSKPQIIALVQWMRQRYAPGKPVWSEEEIVKVMN
jgi:Xaa-Pro aminopeptidase